MLIKIVCYLYNLPRCAVFAMKSLVIHFQQIARISIAIVTRIYAWSSADIVSVVRWVVYQSVPYKLFMYSNKFTPDGVLKT